MGLSVSGSFWSVTGSVRVSSCWIFVVVVRFGSSFELIWNRIFRAGLKFTVWSEFGWNVNVEVIYGIQKG